MSRFGREVGAGRACIMLFIFLPVAYMSWFRRSCIISCIMAFIIFKLHLKVCLRGWHTTLDLRVTSGRDRSDQFWPPV